MLISFSSRSILNGSLFFLFYLAASSYTQAQFGSGLQLNGVLYEVVPEDADKPRTTFLWSLELEDLTRSYENAESNLKRKRASVLFFSEVSGRDWRKMWGEHIHEVYAQTPEQVNDHAEAFFKITGSFPETLNPGDRFSLERSADGSTRAYVNDRRIAQTLKPGHFEFWLRAWHTGAAMPERFTGNLLSGGFVPEDLLEAFVNSAPPIWKPPEATSDVEQEVSDDQSRNAIQVDGEVVMIADSLIPQNVVPVILSDKQGPSSR